MAINIKNINYSIKEGESERKVIDDLSFDIKDNSIVAIMGESGAGKTTLLNIMSGFLHSTSGDVEIDGFSIIQNETRKIEKFRRDNIAIIHQESNLFDFLNVEENIQIQALLKKVEKSKIDADIEKYLKLFRLEKKRKSDVQMLSGGEKQRVAIIRALIGDVKYIFADEPTGSLDSENSKLFMEYLVDITKQKNITVIMVTHSELVSSYCNTVLHLADGKLI